MRPHKTAVIGLGAMGMGMAQSAHAAGLQTVGMDINPAAMETLAAAGATVAETPAKAAAGADSLTVVVVNAAQTEAVLFGANGAADALPEGAVVLGCATVPADTCRQIAARVEERGLYYLDAPISGGAAKAVSGELTVMASGASAAFDRAKPFLDATSETVFDLGREAGQGSTMKMVNQLLAGVHIATAMEAVALGLKAGLDAQSIYDVITQAAGNSWMFGNRVPRVIAGDYQPKSAVGIFTKDLGIVLSEAERLGIDLPLATTALTRYQAAADMGLKGEDDAAVIKVYAEAAGIDLPEPGA